MGATQAAGRIGESVAQLAQIVGRSIGEAVVRLSPDVFGRIEFRGVRGEVVHMEPRMRSQEVADFTSAMNRAAIPKQIDRATQVVQEVTEESLDIEAGEIVRATPQVECHSPAFRRHRHRATDRQTIVAVQVTNAGRLSLGCPGPAHIRDQ